MVDYVREMTVKKSCNPSMANMDHMSISSSCLSSREITAALQIAATTLKLT